MNTHSRFIKSFIPVAALLALFAFMTVSSMLRKSATFDEPLHLAAGYSYWTQNEYRFSTENGNLAQRWAALPLLFGTYHFPQKVSGNFSTGFDFLFNSGNDARKILMQGRAMMVLLGVALGVLVYLWSSELFGRAGGLISLTLYCYSPAILAHAQVATSDLTVALFFTFSIYCIWKMLHRVSVFSVAISAFAIGSLFVAKMSALLIIPMALLLIAIRLYSSESVSVEFSKSKQVTSRKGRALVFLLLMVAQVILVSGVVRAYYGFRFSASKVPIAKVEEPVEKAPIPQVPKPPGKQIKEPEPLPGSLSLWLDGLIAFARTHHLVPEAYLRGLQVVFRHSLVKPAFFNGEYGAGGWFWFFPYCFLVKTPLPLFLILLLAAAAAPFAWRLQSKQDGLPFKAAAVRGLYRTSPLWVLLAIYWVVAVNTRLNIGERHILPVYPATFILAGAAAFWLKRRYLAPASLVVAAVGLFALESARIWPDYLAYFNQIVGGPKNGYKHLVDSSLDWGQDLPALKQWLQANGLDRQKEVPVYLSYFGSGNPSFYGIEAERLPGYLDMDVTERGIMRLKGGVYCISATMLQMVPIFPRGHWSYDYEQQYQPLVHTAYLALADQGPGGAASLRRRTIPDEIKDQLRFFPYLQLGRLCAYLRTRTPDHFIGYSILVYRLTDQDVKQALFMPPSEMKENDAVLVGLRPPRE